MPSLPETFRTNLTRSCRIQSGDTLLVAVSGGPDSMALLHLLAGVQERLHLSLTVVWVDHCLRPLETPQEHKVVAIAAKQLNLPFIACRVDVLSFASEQRLSIEHAARELRYKTLREAAADCSADCIAVAHTADDQAEEILLRLLRGSGRKGMSGMRQRSGDIVRPLLEINKQELLVWLDKEGVEYCMDSSNDDLRFLRNRVRNQLLPFLEEHFDAGIKKCLRKTADSLAVDEELLAELTDAAVQEVLQESEKEKTAENSTKIIQLLRNPFYALHPAIQRRVVEHLLWNMGSKARYDHILLIVQAAFAGRNNSELHLSQGLRVGIYREFLEFSYPAGKMSWRGRLL